jgi:phosphate-selective porin OprO and OprP
MSHRKYLLGSVALCGVLALAAPVHAQSGSALNSQIQALQDQVRQLNSQLHTLQGQVQQQQQTQSQTQHTVEQMKSSPGGGIAGAVVKMMHGRPVFESADGQDTLGVTGRLHFDMGAYDWHPNSTATNPQTLTSGVNARRARLGVTGKYRGGWDYTLIFDLGGSHDNGATIENAFIGYSWAPGFHFTAGYQDVPFTLGESTSSNDIMFMEKSQVGDIATNIAGNDNRAAVGITWHNNRAWVGIFGTGPSSGTTSSINDQTGQSKVQFGATGRATYQVLQGSNYTFHIGADAEGLIKPPNSSGFRAISLADNPELRVDATNTINTGTIGSITNPVTGASVYGAEVAGNFGPLYGQGEYYHFDVARQGLSDLNFNGGYVAASYALTGEERHYNPGCGCYGSIKPAHPFSLSSGGWGAWEIAARYSVMDLNDSTIRGGKQTIYTIGLNWYPNDNMRFMLDYLHAVVKKTQTSAPTDIGGDMNAVAMRMQFAF